MAQRRLSMRKTREILRLRYTADPGLRAIARSCQVSPTAVKRTLSAAEAVALTWPLPADLSDSALEQLLLGGSDLVFADEFADERLPILQARRRSTWSCSDRHPASA